MLKLPDGFIPMKKFPSIGRQNSTRWILIFGVMIGLFFSGGEGVQLFPFPISESVTSKNAASVLKKNLKSYAYSIHNSGSHSTLFKSKLQKQTNHYLPEENSTFNWSNFRANFCLQSAHDRREANLSHTSVFLSSPSDRGPPTV